MNNDELLLWALRRVRMQVIKGHHSGDGLCGALCHQLDEFPVSTVSAVKRRMYALWRDWPKFSGSNMFPLPGGPAAYSASVGSGRAWEQITRQGRDRRELLDWLIKRLEVLTDEH